MEGQSCRNEIRRDASNNLEANVQIRNPVLTKTPTGHQVKVVLEQRMNLDIGIDGLRGITDEKPKLPNRDSPPSRDCIAEAYEKIPARLYRHNLAIVDKVGEIGQTWHRWRGAGLVDPG